VHWAGSLLDPTSHLQVINAIGKKLAKEWIYDHTEDQKEISASLQDFLMQQNGFTKSHVSQLHVKDPVWYWKCSYDHPEHYKLAKLAIQLFETIANSVVSE
jgi:hypothetical protein